MSKIKSYRKGSASARRKDPAKGRIKAKRISAHKVPGGSRRRNGNDSATGNANAPLLNPGFKQISRFELGDTVMIPQTNNTNEVRLEEGLPILHKCLQQHPKFKDNKDWRTVPKISRVADYLVSKVRYLRPAKHTWKFDRDVHGEPRLIYYQQLGYRPGAIMLEWLPMLEKQDARIYAFALEVLNMVAYSWKLQVVKHEYAEYYLNDDIENQLDGDPAGDKTLLWDHKKYRGKGIANHYRKLLTKRPTMTADQLQKKMDAMPYGNTYPTRSVSEWLRDAIEVIKLGQDIRNYYTPGLLEDMNTDDGHPVRPQDSFCFMWSHQDCIGQYIQEGLDQTFQHVGEAHPVIKCELYPGKKMIHVPKEPIRKLNYWMFEGNKIYHRFYVKRLMYARQKHIATFSKKKKSNLLIDILT